MSTPIASKRDLVADERGLTQITALVFDRRSSAFICGLILLAAFRGRPL
jgi:hypothetical protein